jgi:hypothetical protein
MLMLERARPDRVVVDVVPLVDAPLVDAPLVDMLPLVPLLGMLLLLPDVLLPDVLVLVALVSRVVLVSPLDTPDELPLTPVVVVLLPLAFVRFRSTSPPDAPVVPLRCTEPLAGTQFVVLTPFDVAVFVPVPVPFAPLVVFRPVKR